MSGLTTQLKNVPLFSTLHNRQIEVLCKVGTIKEYQRGAVIVNQGAIGDTFYVIVSGSVKVTIINEDGREIILAVLSEGDFFGELALMDNEPRSATIVAMDDASLFLLTRNQFRQLVIAHPIVLKNIHKKIYKRLRNANEKIESMAFLDVYGRTVALLQRLAYDQSTKTGNVIEIKNAPTHKELADIVGTARETITRIIKILKNNGNIVSFKRRRIVLREYTKGV